MCGSQTTESRPLNNKDVAESVVALGDSDVQSATNKHKIRKIIGRYHSALEHTFLWIVDAEHPPAIKEFCLETGFASLNLLTIVPFITFSDGVIPLVKRVHAL